MEQEKKNVIRTVIDGFKESAKAVHEINKQNIAEVKADSRANFIEATTPGPEFINFKQAKGLKGKAKAALDGLKASAKAASEKEKERRAEIRNHTAYKDLLQEQRAYRQAVIRKRYS